MLVYLGVADYAPHIYMFFFLKGTRCDHQSKQMSAEADDLQD